MSRIARAALSLGLITALVAYVGPAEIVRPLAAADARWVAAAFAAMTIDRWLMALKWTRLLRSRDVVLPVWSGLKIYCTAMFCGLLLPSTLGADAMRTYLARRHGLPAGSVLASILVERMIGFIASLGVGLLGLLILDSAGVLDSRFAVLGTLGPLALAAAVGGFALSLHRGLFERAYAWLPVRLAGTRLAERFAELHRSYAGFGASRRALAEFFALTLLEQFVTIAGAWLTALAVGVHVSLWFMAGVLPLTLLVARLPISVAGIGVFESVFLLLMGLGGVAPAQALSVVLIGWLVQTATWLPWCMAELIESSPLPAAPRSQGLVASESAQRAEGDA